MGRKAEHESDSLDVRCVCDCECVRESFFPYTVRCNGTRTDVLCYAGSSSDLTPLPVGNNVWFRISVISAKRRARPPPIPPPVWARRSPIRADGVCLVARARVS